MMFASDSLQTFVRGAKRPIMLRIVLYFRSLKVRVRDCSLYFWQSFTSVGFTQQRATMAFSLVNDQVMLEDRHFNRIGHKQALAFDET